MDYIREAVEFLKNYENLKQSLENLKLDILELRSELDCGQMGAIEYSDMPTGDGCSLPGDDIINKMYVLQVKRKLYSDTKRTLSKMDKILSGMPKEQVIILKAWYIEGLRGDTVLKHTKCSERNFYRQKNEALKVFAVQLHGIIALK